MQFKKWIQKSELSHGDEVRPEYPLSPRWKGLRPLVGEERLNEMSNWKIIVEKINKNQ